MAASRDHLGGDPPESTRLRLGDDIAWSEINGVYDRDDSLKENTNPKCVVKSSHQPGGGGSSSQRFSGNLKPTAAPIIGLSGKFGGSVRRHHHPPAMFPRKARTGGGGRAPMAAVPEPGSPKVSCIGKVLSDRERARLGRGSRGARAPGCCGGIGFLMRRSRSRHSVVECVDQSPPPPPFPPLAHAEPARRREATFAATEPEPEPALAPGLGGVRRFASGRRPAE